MENGNWISGIKFIDEARLGKQTDLPKSMTNAGRTTFYFLPLILGLIGLFYQIKKDIKNSWVVFLLFFMTGLAIVIYLNQTPYQPRERDYAYAGSFYAFCIWIGFGVLGIVELLQKLLKNKMIAAVVAFVLCLSVPAVMAASGWEGHNRSNKTAALDWGKNYLKNLPENAVIFTRGDNDTFPLWYVQEVEGYRTDVRVCNYMLASGYWYVHQMGRKQYESERLPLSLTPEQYDNRSLRRFEIWAYRSFPGGSNGTLHRDSVHLYFSRRTEIPGIYYRIRAGQPRHSLQRSTHSGRSNAGTGCTLYDPCTEGTFL